MWPSWMGQNQSRSASRRLLVGAVVVSCWKLVRGALNKDVKEGLEKGMMREVVSRLAIGLFEQRR